MSFSESRGFEPKSPKELRDQFRAVNDVVTGGEKESSLIPPSVKEKDVLKMSEEDIKNAWPYRYEMYLRLVREMKQFRNEKSSDEDSQMSEEELSEMKKWLTALNSLDTYITKHKEGNGEVTLRERQLTVFEDVRKFLEHGGTEGYVKLPTGVGKTVLFTELVEAMDLPTLIVVPTRILIDQTEEKIEQFAPDLDVGKIYSGSKEFGRQVTIITYQSLVLGLESGTLDPMDYDAVILDEVHTALTGKRTNAISQFEHAIKIGFTATPEYSKDKKVSNILNTEIHSMSIREGVEEGLLSSFSSLVAHTDTDLTNVKVNKSDEYDEKELARAINIQSRNQAAVQLYQGMFVGQSAITYCAGVEHATTMMKLFRESGVAAEVISGKTSIGEQRELKAKFKSGEIKVLCNADILIAGFDEPHASVCLNLRPTRSRVVAEQRGGRVLRVDKDNEEKHATVVDFLDQGLEKRPPVLFAEVADGAEILHKKKGKGGGSGVRPEYPTIHIDGLNIILDTEEILRIVNERKIQETKKERIPLDQLKKEVRAAGINSIYKYTMARQEHRSWPSRPENTFKNSGWVSWSDFFGTKHRFEYEKISLEQLKVELVRLGVSTSDVYKELLSTHLSWPSNPHTFYKDWKGWPDLFGRDEKKSNVEKISFDKLKDEVKELGISTSAEYCVVSPRHPTWPAQPLDYYSKRGLTVSWNELFGKESVKKLSLEELKVAVRKEGVNSKAKYKEVYKLNSLWPSDPKVFYRDAWISWADLFGKSG